MSSYEVKAHREVKDQNRDEPFLREDTHTEALFHHIFPSIQHKGLTA